MTKKLIEQWKKDEMAPFQGWDFSYLKRRRKSEKPNWNYELVVKRLIKKSNAVLDMATGGGEVFSEILSVYRPQKTIVIEGYKPNVSVARKNLKKHNVKVIYANETKKLSFKNGEFDLVLNRHGGLNIKEIGRILSPGGIFLTQQVDSRDLIDLEKKFKAKPKYKSNILSFIIKQLKDRGFTIIKKNEWKGKTIFKDVGAIVYLLKAIPWIVEGFSVKKHQDILKKLQKKIEKKGKLEFTIRRFFILAIKN